MKTFADILSWINADTIEYKGDNVKVAVLDSGVNQDHPLLQGKVLSQFDFTGNGTGDRFGHGTAVASLVATVAPNCKIIDIKVLNDLGQGDFTKMMQGCEKALELGAQIINMSMAGGDGCLQDSTVARFIDTIAGKGVIVICAAGNSGPATSPKLPAMARKAVAVGAVQSDSVVADFSSRGPVCDTRAYPDCSAPGVDLEIANFQGGTTSGSGTSFATPIVSGIFALVVQKLNGTLYRENIETLLTISCYPLSNSKNDDLGWGRLDAAKAVNFYAALPPPLTEPQPALNPFILIGGAAALSAAYILMRKDNGISRKHKAV